MRIFHIATATDWVAATATGSYTTSTLGRSLAEEGFIHAARREQVAGVFAGFYREAGEPLVLLTIDTDRLTSSWREDPVGDDTFPHIFGPLNTSAVRHVAPLNRRGGTETMTGLFAKEMFLRIVLAIVAMLLAAAGSELGGRLESSWGPLLGALAGLLAGAAVFVVVLRRR